MLLQLYGRMVKEISAPELEASCRKCLRLTVSDARPLTAALDKMGLEYSIRSDTEADVYRIVPSLYSAFRNMAANTAVNSPSGSAMLK